MSYCLLLTFQLTFVCALRLQNLPSGSSFRSSSRRLSHTTRNVGFGREQDRAQDQDMELADRPGRPEDVFHVHTPSVAGVGPRAEVGVRRRSRPVHQVR